jgi:putative membrane protein insertion efficiency factor
MGKISYFLRKITCFPIYLYRFLFKPFIQPCCRYSPSCSQYALHAISYYGVGKGLLLTTRRLLRCHPWGGFGYDPVLPNDEKN